MNFQVWISATRPKTLVTAVAPVLIGASLAFRDGAFETWVTVLALVCAILIQIGTNFANDYYDFKKGADTAERLGFVRATSAGLISPETMFSAIWITMTLAFVLGLGLVWQGGWPILLLGVFSIVCGWAYTGGPYPLGYNGLGDIFVFLFFGIAAVCGTYFVNALALPLEIFGWSVGVGALAVNILVVNNFRDIETDRKVKKRTLGVLFGERALLLEYGFMVFLAVFTPVLMTFQSGVFVLSLAGLAALPGFLLLREMATVTDKRMLNKTLEKTAKLVGFYGLATSLILIFGS